MRRKPKQKVKTIGVVSEDNIQKAVALHLGLRGRPDLYWFHVPNGGSRHMLEAVKLKAMGVKAGVPDLCLIAGGKPYFLELKTTKGRISDVQKLAAEMATNAGATYAVARGLDAALAQLEAWGMFMSGRPIR